MISRILAAAAVVLSLAACSGSQSGSSALPTGSSASSNTGSRHAMGGYSIEATIAFKDAVNPTGPLIAGQPMLMTITLEGPAQTLWQNVIAYALPKSANGQFETTSGPIATTCAGLTSIPFLPAGSTSFTLSNSAFDQLTQPCVIRARLIAPAAGNYTIGNLTWGAGTINWQNVPDTLTVTAPQDHLYVPVHAVPNQGSVQIFNEPPSSSSTTVPICTLTSSTAIPNPIAVAVNPGNGSIFVLDAAGTVTVFNGINEGAQCNTTPVTTWPVSSDAVSLTVDQNNEVVVSGCSGVTWYDFAGEQVRRIPGGSTAGNCDGDVSANYWAGYLYLQQLNPDEIITYKTPPSGPVGQYSTTPDTVFYRMPDSTVPVDQWHIAAASGNNVSIGFMGDRQGPPPAMLPIATSSEVAVPGSIFDWGLAKGPYLNGDPAPNGIAYDLITGEFSVAQGAQLANQAAPSYFKSTVFEYGGNQSLTYEPILTTLGSGNLGSGSYISGIDYGP